MANIVLQTEGLTKRYGAFTAVNSLTLEVKEGEVFGFLGPNGAGKTTTINMICGLLKPDNGRVLIKRKPINHQDAGLRKQVGMCPQNIVLWERLTCLEQLVFMGQMYGMDGPAARRSAERLLADLDLQDRRDRLSRTLSGGLQRRLNLAMALVHDPEIVVLDEPEAGLDPQSRVRVREYIQSLARSHTVILTTHDMDEADRLADRVAIIDHGELLVLDTPDALKRRLGEGDLLEIHLADGALDLAAVQGALALLASDIRLDPGERTLQVRALNAVNNLPAILAALQQAGARPAEVSIRANTLEDVFIQLTGRRLRE